MKSKFIARPSIVLALVLAAIGGQAAAQNTFSPDTGSSTATSPTRTDSRILYHNGPVLTGTKPVYLVWYGNWSARVYEQLILADFISNLGSSPYFQINTGYPDSAGQAPNGALNLGGGGLDPYSHGATLTETNVADVVANQFRTGGMVFDPRGIYVVLTSPDIALEDGATHFCQTCCNLHGDSVYAGSSFTYVFVGHPERCPTGCATQFPNRISPNGDYAVDAMVSWLAHALNAVVTNPTGSGWYDRYGLENSEKCEDTYGTTYSVPVVPYGEQLAEANVKLATATTCSSRTG